MISQNSQIHREKIMMVAKAQVELLLTSNKQFQSEKMKSARDLCGDA